MEVVGDEFFDGALGVVVSGLLETLGEGLNEWQHGLFVVAWFDAEVFDAVVDDALGGLEVAGDGGGVAAMFFEGVDKNFAFVAFDHLFEVGAVFGDETGAGFVAGLQGGGKVEAVNDAVGGGENGAFDTVFEFADVAGPVVGHDHVDGAGGDALHLFSVEFGVFLEEVVGEKKDVGFTFAEWGEEDGEDVEAVEEVFTEDFVGHAFFKVTAGGSNDADVDGDGFVAADAFEGFFL